jgi:hypothetical protein
MPKRNARGKFGTTGDVMAGGVHMIICSVPWALTLLRRDKPARSNTRKASGESSLIDLLQMAERSPRRPK